MTTNTFSPIAFLNNKSRFDLLLHQGLWEKKRPWLQQGFKLTSKRLADTANEAWKKFSRIIKI